MSLNKAIWCASDLTAIISVLVEELNEDLRISALFIWDRAKPLFIILLFISGG